jgi:serine protease Do
VEGDSGVLVAEVLSDGPADRAGVQRGDLILEVNRQAVQRPEQVVQLVGKMKPGQVALLRVRRGQSAVYLPVRIPEKQEEPKK